MTTSIVIHDIKIKSLLRKLNQTSTLDSMDNDIYYEILDNISQFIYNFPRIKYHKNKDICSDFYVYTLDYLYEILMKFDIKGKASFQTWFSVVLFNLWRNYINTKKNRDYDYSKINTQMVDDINIIDRYKFLREHLISKSKEGLFINKKEIDSLDNCFQKMPKKVRVVIKAHYFELFKSSDITEAVDAFQLDFMVTLRKYEVLVTKTREQYKSINNLIDNVNEIIYELKRLEFIKNKNQNDDVIINKAEKLNQRKEKLVKKLKTTYIKLTPKQIADFFNTNANSVSNLLHRGKNYIKDFYDEITTNE
jgi:RNA polymerase sigma factor (sigma-70 family)